MITRDPDVWTSHPSWFLVPSSVKDGTGPSGGTLQVRITAHNCAHQTDPPLIQKFRRSRFKGGSLIHVDLSQAELRTAALLSGEQTLIDAFVGNQDLHSRRAHFIWGDALFTKYPSLTRDDPESWSDLDEFKHFERQISKMVNFADLFRSGATTMGDQIYARTGLRVEASILEAAARGRPKARPQLWAWQETLLAEAHSTGRVTLPLVGSHRTFMNNPDDTSAKWEGNEIVNYPCQSIAALSLLDWQSLLTHRWWGNENILLYLNVYDALEIDVAPGYEEQCKSDIEETFCELTTTGLWGSMQQHTGHEVPLEYDIDIHTFDKG